MAVPGRFSIIRSVIAGLTLTILGCVSPGQLSPGRQLPPIAAPAPLYPLPVSLTVHVDDAFTATETQLLHAAAISLDIQSQGLLQVTLVSGLDTARFAVPHGHWKLLRLVSGADLTTRFDYRNATGKPDIFVGLCVRPSSDIYLVPDRIRTERQFLSVAMHEMLHAVGVEHREDSFRQPPNVMSPGLRDDAPVRLSPVDLDALRLTLLLPR